jgi:glutamine phosphoribosylpyrophosphate amidotransferase
MGINIPSRTELIAANKSLLEIKQHINVHM